MEDPEQFEGCEARWHGAHPDNPTVGLLSVSGDGVGKLFDTFWQEFGPSLFIGQVEAVVDGEGVVRQFLVADVPMVASALYRWGVQGELHDDFAPRIPKEPLL